jgi:hypothetical protein
MFETYQSVDASLLIRTDFSDDAAWALLCAAVQAPESTEGFLANFVCVSDPAIAMQPPEDIAAQVHGELLHSAIYFADEAAFSDPTYPVLCIDGSGAAAESFRVIAEQMWGPENNLRLGNMDYADFLGAVEPDGVFRGF